MSDKSKELASRWGPLVVSIVINLILVAYGYGQMVQRLTPLEEHAKIHTVESDIKLFVTKSEWSLRNDTRDREVTDMKETLRRIESKLDRSISDRNE
jgi:hypothetical protein